MTRTREWLIGYAVAAAVCIGVGHEIADAARPPVPTAVRAACVDVPGNMFNECATIDATQVTDRREETTRQAPNEGPVAGRQAPTTARAAVILVIQGDYLARAGQGVLSDADVAALLPVYRVAEETGLPCADMARTLQRTGDYRADMVGCFGEEDSPAVDAILRSVGR